MSQRVPQPHQLDSVDVINVGSAINDDGTVGDSDCGVRLAAVLDEASSALLCGLSADEQLKRSHAWAVALEQGGSSEHEAFSAEGCASM